MLTAFMAVGMTAPCQTTTATPVTDNAAFQTIDKLIKCDTDKKAFRAGYAGDTATLDELKNANQISYYCVGAAVAGHTELVMRCLKKGAKNNDALAGAAAGGHTELVMQLLKSGASISVALQSAALGGHMELVQLMLEYGANPKAGLKGAAEV